MFSLHEVRVGTHVENALMWNLPDDLLLAAILSVVFFIKLPIQCHLGEGIVLPSPRFEANVRSAVAHDLLELRLVDHAVLLVEVVPNIVKDGNDLSADVRVERWPLILLEDGRLI